jgi:hypothetical protein
MVAKAMFGMSARPVASVLIVGSVHEKEYVTHGSIRESLIRKAITPFSPGALCGAGIL